MDNSMTHGARMLRPSRHLANQKGFSLIELMLAVAIVGIIAAVGFPSYVKHVNKTRRADGHLALMNASSSLDQCQSTNFVYTNCTLPEYLKASDEGNYAITLETSSNSFTLTATAQAKQLADEICPTMTLDDKGQQGFTGDGPCW